MPNVIGMKVVAARAALRAATLSPVSLNAPCNMGGASQSVVASLATPGTTADPRVGAVPLSPGALVAQRSAVGITWSGCYGDASRVPAVVGLSLPAARQALRAVGLAWACSSVGVPTTTDDRCGHVDDRGRDDDDPAAEDGPHAESSRADRAAAGRHRVPHHVPLPPVNGTP